ncbi:MAG TPA: cyanophycin synthetase, partial [Burkholderiaceae bacterium]
GLVALLPTLQAHRCSLGRAGGFIERLRDGTYMGHIVEHVMLELQCMVGTPAGFGRTRMARGRPGVYRVVCAYQIEQVAVEAFDLALHIVQSLARGETPDIADALAQLKQTAEHGAIGTSTAAVLAAAKRRGIPYQRLTETANLFQLGWGSKQKRLQATITGDTNHIAVGIASDKQLTKALLEEAGVPVPRGETVTTEQAAIRAAQRLRGAVTVKPLDGNQGKGVTTACKTDAEVEAAFAHARKHGRRVIVEQYLEGYDYRVLVAGGRIAAASCRRPPNVVGDGVRTIRELVEIENLNPARGAGHTNILTKIALDEQADALLAKQGYTSDTVLAEGATAWLRGNANLSTGGTAEDVTDLVHETTRDICLRAARKVGLDVAGIDIVCQDIARPLLDQRGGIIEVNAAPGIRMHQYPSRGVPRDAGEAIIDGMFPQGDGRIPTVAVTGTNGKTTTALMVAHAAQVAGLTSGVTTTQGVYIANQQIAAGDCTGYWSARNLLSAPEVDFAVLETARGGILKRGLGFDRCDVAIVTNISADHLGLDGVETVEDLARVKAVVANSAARAVVLNAEDALCMGMTRKLRPEAEVIVFSMDPDNGVLLRHLAQGGRAAYLQDKTLVLADGTRHTALLHAQDMPSTLGGHARYNIANALAAAAGLMAADFTFEQIAAGLTSFVSNARNNPLRSNVFDVRGVTVVVDYAHNPAAYAALSQMARSLSRNRVVGVVTAPGDRRDMDLRAVGKVCAEGFDELIVYESSSRGRPYGETTQLLSEGAREAGTAMVETELEMHAAVKKALARCQPGDVLIFACATTVHELIDAIRPDDPACADRLAEQAASNGATAATAAVR